MKKKTQIFLTLFLAAAAFPAFTQVPQKFSYQAVCRDNTGNIIAAQPVLLRFTLHDSLPLGPVLYRETHTTGTNNFGLVNIAVGNGVPDSGNFSAIAWGTNEKFLEVELNTGASFEPMGTQQLLSVPFALYSANGGTTGPQGPTGPQGIQGPSGPQGIQGQSGVAGCDLISAGDMVVVYTSTHAYGFSQDQSSGSTQPFPDDNPGQWVSVALNDTVIGYESSEKQIVIYTQSYAYGFSQDQSSGSSQPHPDDNPGQWTPVALSGTPLASFHSQKQVVVVTSTNAYGFSQNQSSGSTQPFPDDDAGQWTSVAISGTLLGGKASNKNIVIYTTTHAYGFSQDQSSGISQPHPDDNLGQWTTVTLSGLPKGIVNTR